MVDRLGDLIAELNTPQTQRGEDYAISQALGPALSGTFAEQNPDPYEQAENTYYMQQDQLNAQYGKGKDAEVKNFMPRAEWERLNPQSPPTELAPVLQDVPRETPQQLTPCDLGYCGANSGSYLNGRPLLQENYDRGFVGLPNGGGLLAQRLSEGRLHSLGATIGAVEKTNKEQEQYNIESLRRSPEWYAKFQETQQLYPNQPELAMKQADIMLGNTYGGQIGSEVNRYLGQEAQNKINAYANTEGATALTIPNYAESNPIPITSNGVNPSSTITGVQNNEDGSNNINYLINGANYTQENVAPANTVTSVLATQPTTNLETLNTNVLALEKNQLATEQLKQRQQSAEYLNEYRQGQLENRAEANDINRYKAHVQELNALQKRSGITDPKKVAQLSAQPKEFTALGRASYYKSLVATNDHIKDLGGGGVYSNAFSRAKGFAPDGLINSELLANSQSRPEVHQQFQQYNRAHSLLEDAGNWGDSERVRATIAQVQEAVRVMMPTVRAYEKSTNAEIAKTSQQLKQGITRLQSGLAQLQTRERDLRAFEDARAESEALQMGLQSIQDRFNSGYIGGL